MTHCLLQVVVVDPQGMVVTATVAVMVDMVEMVMGLVDMIVVMAEAAMEAEVMVAAVDMEVCMKYL